MNQLCLALDSISRIRLQKNHTTMTGQEHSDANRLNGLVYCDIHLLLVLNLIMNGTKNGANIFYIKTVDLEVIMALLSVPHCDFRTDLK